MGTGDRWDRPLLTSRYEATRALTEVLAEPLSPEDQTVQSMPDVSPTKWHRGHTSWFFETFLLEPNLSSYEPFHPAFGYIFNSYYEAVGARHPRSERGLVSRPGIAEVADYRRHVDKSMGELLRTVQDDGARALVELGINHEQQHQELLLMDIKHVLSRSPLQPPYRPVVVQRDGPSAPTQAPDPLAGGSTAAVWPRWVTWRRLRVRQRGPRHPVHLTPFALADRPVTCGEWLEFMNDGGYTDPSSGCPTGGRWSSNRAGGHRCTGPEHGRRARSVSPLAGLHSGRTAGRGSRRAGLPRELLRGRRLRPLDRVPPPYRSGVGESPPRETGPRFLPRPRLPAPARHAPRIRCALR